MKLFGLAPQPKGIGDRQLSPKTIGNVTLSFGLAPQPKGIGDVSRQPTVGLVGYGLD